MSQIKAFVHVHAVVKVSGTELCPVKFQWIKRSRTSVLFPIWCGVFTWMNFMIFSFSCFLGVPIAYEAYSRNPTQHGPCGMPDTVSELPALAPPASGWAPKQLSLCMPKVSKGLMERVTCTSVPHPSLKMRFLLYEKSSTNFLFSLLKHNGSYQGAGHLFSTLQQRHCLVSLKTLSFFAFLFFPSFCTSFLFLKDVKTNNYFILKDCLLDVYMKLYLNDFLF